jgi:hypothetical protein
VEKEKEVERKERERHGERGKKVERQIYESVQKR